MAKRRKSDEIAAEIATKRFDAARAEVRHKNAMAEAKRELAALYVALDRAERDRDTLLALDDPRQRAEWERSKRSTGGEATAVCLWSDWHVEQHVTKAETNGLNEWGPRHAETAAKKLIERTCDVVIPRYRLAAKIESLVVWLGGDFIEGHLREEQKARNAMTPIRAMQFAEDLLERALREIADRSGMKQITIVTSTGNHDRTTEKTWASARNDTSYATLIYDHLRKLFKNHPKIQWQAEAGEMTYHQVYDYKCRFVHGDSIMYRGGRDGLSGPANIQIRKWNDSIDADFTFFGDKHTYLWNDQIGFVANGALCGPAAYSMRYGRSLACQAVAIIDKKHGMTDSTKVFCR